MKTKYEQLLEIKRPKELQIYLLALGSSGWVWNRMLRADKDKAGNVQLHFGQDYLSFLDVVFPEKEHKKIIWQILNNKITTNKDCDSLLQAIAERKKKSKEAHDAEILPELLYRNNIKEAAKHHSSIQVSDDAYALANCRTYFENHKFGNFVQADDALMILHNEIIKDQKQDPKAINLLSFGVGYIGAFQLLANKLALASAINDLKENETPIGAIISVDNRHFVSLQIIKVAGNCEVRFFDGMSKKGSSHALHQSHCANAY
jgi:hypothetical protein